MVLRKVRRSATLYYWRERRFPNRFVKKYTDCEEFIFWREAPETGVGRTGGRGKRGLHIAPSVSTMTVQRSLKKTSYVFT